MTLLSRQLRRGDLVVDTSAKLTLEQAHRLRAAGVDAVWRYVFFGPPRPGDLDASELAELTGAGLTVLVVQHVRNPGWHASADQGEADAQAAVSNAIRADHIRPEGSHRSLSIALDMEGVGNPGPDSQAHALAWCAVVRAAGYLPVIYVGYDSGLSTVGLAALAAAGPVAWWCDFAAFYQRPTPPSPGYAGHQHSQTTLEGVSVDRDDVLIDDAIWGLAEAPDQHIETADTLPAPPPEDA